MMILYTIPRLYPILDTGLFAKRNCSVVVAAEAMLAGGARILQFRHKSHFSRVVFETAERVAELCRQAGAIFVVNDRADAALLLDAGLHLGQEDLPPSDGRRLIGPDRLLGFSTHNPAQFAAALKEPADYLAFGPIFPTRTKENPDPVVGLNLLPELATLAHARGRPLVAIGGITPENAPGVLAAGADSVAVISGLLPESCGFAALRARMEEWQELVRG